MKKMNAGAWTAVFLFLFSLLFLYLSLQFPYNGILGIGPGFFPVWLCIILLILSILYLMESLRNQQDDEVESMPRGEALKKIVFIIASLIIFMLLLSFAGFLLSGIIFLFILLYRSYKWYISAGISAAATLIVFWLFDLVLGVPLPVNGLGW